MLFVEFGKLEFGKLEFLEGLEVGWKRFGELFDHVEWALHTDGKIGQS